MMTPADRAAREGALLVPRPDWGTIEVTGSERLSWLQGLVTCDVAELPVGEARWGLVLNKPGKIQTDVTVVAAADRVLVALPSRVEAAIAEGLARFLVMEDAELELSSSRSAWAALHGPRAAEVAEGLARALEGKSAPVDYTGLGGAVLVVDSSRSAALLQAARSRPDLVVGMAGDWGRLRVERRVPELGVDMGPELNPHEASLDRRAVSWTKGCYLGQEAVCMQDMRGRVKRRLVLLRVESAAPPEAGTVVSDEGGAVVGKVTHAVPSEVLGAVAALSLVAAASSETGTRLVVGGARASVVEPV